MLAKAQRPMFRWSDFEEAAPELAALGRERIDRFRFVLVGTTRKDGSPRISPVEARIIDGHLLLNMLRGSLKVLDLLRNPLILLHSPVLNADDPNSEFKLRGRAVEVEDAGLRKALADATWHPPPESQAFAIDIESAAFLAWEKGELTMTRWSRERGLATETRYG